MTYGWQLTCLGLGSMGGAEEAQLRGGSLRALLQPLRIYTLQTESTNKAILLRHMGQR